MTIPAPKGPGRPTSYSVEIADLICERLMDGESLRRICLAEEMPHRVTVLRWLVAHEDFRKRYAVARELQAEVADDRINELIDTCTPETAQADRVKLAALQWRAAKLAPKKYGDRIAQEHSGPDGEPVTVRWLNDEDDPHTRNVKRASAILNLLNKAGGDTWSLPGSTTVIDGAAETEEPAA